MINCSHFVLRIGRRQLSLYIICDYRLEFERSLGWLVFTFKVMTVLAPLTLLSG
jgi:hypothetical protein